jgi:HK97 family phage major capsid protein
MVRPARPDGRSLSSSPTNLLEETRMKTTRIFALVVALALAAFSVPALAGVFDPAAAAAPFFLDPQASLIGIGVGGTIEQLRKLAATRQIKFDAMQAITTAAAAAADGMMTAEQRTQFDAIKAEIEALDGDIARIKASMEAARGVQLPDGSRLQVVDNQRDAPNHGFRSFGEFALAVFGASAAGATPDARLVFDAASTAPSSYGNVGNGADGGYLVPPEFSRTIVETAYNEQMSFVPFTDNTPVEGNSMAFPVDETTPWSTAGIKAYWTDEAGAGTERKGQFDPAVLRLKKLTALVPLTEELLSDASAIGSYVQRKVPEAIMFKTNEALWSGSGAGKPKGFYSSTGLLVSVAKETSQTADTIVGDNISKMRARMSSRSWRRAMWCINNDALPQLDKLAYGTTATNAQIYKPEGGRFGYGTLLGRDVMVCDFCETVGDKGDIVLIDWGMYRTITKAGGIETASSMHFWFDRGLTAFRSIFRIDGQPSITSPVTPNKGSNSLSPIVTLDARA